VESGDLLWRKVTSEELESKGTRIRQILKLRKGIALVPSHGHNEKRILAEEITLIV